MTGKVPESDGAAQEMTADAAARVAVTSAGASAVAMLAEAEGVTGSDADEGSESPATLLATTVKVYVESSVKPDTVQKRSSVVVHVAPSGEAVTV